MTAAVGPAGAITALTFRNQKQITTKESLDVGKKHAASRGFHAIARLLLKLGQTERDVRAEDSESLAHSGAVSLS